ncbi:MAG: XRE family transcriptional regulator [Alphaproteobacteria bacterium]|nr:MAG: XRE family transcriptional regulator [Alphaproteobacteria bacterium]
MSLQSENDLPTKVSQRPEYAVLARLLVEAREKAGLSQSELGRRLRRGQAYVWKLENAQQSPDLVELLDWATATGSNLPVLVNEFQAIIGAA